MFLSFPPFMCFPPNGVVDSLPTTPLRGVVAVARSAYLWRVSSNHDSFLQLSKSVVGKLDFRLFMFVRFYVIVGKLING